MYRNSYGMFSLHLGLLSPDALVTFFPFLSGEVYICNSHTPGDPRLRKSGPYYYHHTVCHDTGGLVVVADLLTSHSTFTFTDTQRERHMPVCVEKHKITHTQVYIHTYTGTPLSLYHAGQHVSAFH